MPSTPTTRANGSETLRAGSAAMLRFHSTGLGEESPGGGHRAVERRSPALTELRPCEIRSQRSRPQGLDSERLQPLHEARGSCGVSPVGDPSSASSQQRQAARLLEGAKSPAVPAPEPGESSSPKGWHAKQEMRYPPHMTSPAGLGSCSPTATLISALSAQASRRSLEQPRRAAEEERPRSTDSEPQPAPTPEPPASPLYPSEGALCPRTHSRRSRSWRSLTVDIPRKPPAKDVRHIGDRKIFDLYTWNEVLQEQGDGGKVVVCKPKDTPGEDYDYVMKIRSKQALREQYHEEEFRRSQVRMLNIPPHVGVMPLREVLEDDKFYYIVMDKADGGSFFCSLLSDFQDGVLPHSAIKSLIRELLEAVSHVHQQGMLHRDIKPDNLVMQFHSDPTSPGGKAKRVRLIDFDHADPDWSPASPRKGGSCYGTMRFNAPETFLAEYSAESDLYSVGTILYLLMTGKMPYDDDVFEKELEYAQCSPNSRRSWMDEVYLHMKQEQVDWECSPWRDERACKDLCAWLLAFEARDRPRTAEEALAHSWLEQ